MWKQFAAARPGIFGGLLTAVTTAIENLPNTTLHRLPRMADFALWAVAAEPGLGLASGEFINAYVGNREEANSLALEASPVAKLLPELPDEWDGTAAELLAELEKLASDGDKRLRSWPKTPRAIGGALKRLAPNLRAAGIRGQRQILQHVIEPKLHDTFADPEGFLEGLLALLDEIADQAHDNHGIDCLLTEAGDEPEGGDR